METSLKSKTRRWNSDFMSDWRGMMATALTRLGYSVDNNDDAEKVFYKLRSVEKRNVSQKKRQLYISKELKCPKELVAGLEAIKQKVVNGGDLKPHLSKNVLIPNYEDALLTDWDILHFHLYLEPHETIPGLLKRSGPILFARVTEDSFYMLDVKNHGSWADKDLMEIIHKNWPESIKDYKFHGVVGLESEVNETDRKKLRKGAINSFVQVSDGTVYMGPGMGFVSNGQSFRDTQLFIQTSKIVEGLDKEVDKELPERLKQAAAQGRELKGSIKAILVAFKLDKPVVSLTDENGVEVTFLWD